MYRMHRHGLPAIAKSIVSLAFPGGLQQSLSTEQLCGLNAMSSRGDLGLEMPYFTSFLGPDAKTGLKYGLRSRDQCGANRKKLRQRKGPKAAL